MLESMWHPYTLLITSYWRLSGLYSWFDFYLFSQIGALGGL